VLRAHVATTYRSTATSGNGQYRFGQPGSPQRGIHRFRDGAKQYGRARNGSVRGVLKPRIVPTLARRARLPLGRPADNGRRATGSLRIRSLSAGSPRARMPPTLSFTSAVRGDVFRIPGSGEHPRSPGLETRPHRRFRRIHFRCCPNWAGNLRSGPPSLKPNRQAHCSSTCSSGFQRYSARPSLSHWSPPALAETLPLRCKRRRPWKTR
jgi:hypothetical protein